MLQFAKTYSPTGSLLTTLQVHTATLLPNGKVIVTGGHSAKLKGLNDGTGIGIVEVYEVP